MKIEEITPDELSRFMEDFVCILSNHLVRIQIEGSKSSEMILFILLEDEEPHGILTRLHLPYPDFPSTSSRIIGSCIKTPERIDSFADDLKTILKRHDAVISSLAGVNRLVLSQNIIQFDQGIDPFSKITKVSFYSDKNKKRIYVSVDEQGNATISGD